VAIIHQGRVLLVEPLDALKLDTRQLTISTSEMLPAPPDLPGTLLCQRQRGRQWEVLVRGLEESHLDALRQHEGVVAVETRSPALEEIFVAYMRGEKQEAPNESPEPEIAQSPSP